MIKSTWFATVLFICIAGGIFGGIPGLPLWEAQEALIVMGAMLFMALYLIRNPWIKAFAVWYVIRAAMFLNSPSYCTLITTFIFLLFIDHLGQQMTIGKIGKALDVIAAVIVLHSIHVIFQYSGLWITYVPTQVRFNPSDWIQIAPNSVFSLSVFRFISSDGYGLYGSGLPSLAGISGSTGNINIASALIGLGFPALLRRKWWILMPIVLMALYITRSWNGLLPVFIVLMVFFTAKAKKLWWIPVLAISGIGVVYFLQHENFYTIFSMGGRLDAWKVYMLDIFPMRWIEGWGPGQSPFLATILHEKVFSGTAAWRHPHNEYINLLVEAGTVGFVFAAGYIISQVWRLVKQVRRYSTAFIVFLGVLAGLINVCIGFTLHTASGVVFALFLGMMQYINSLNGGKHEKTGNSCSRWDSYWFDCQQYFDICSTKSRSGIV